MILIQTKKQRDNNTVLKQRPTQILRTLSSLTFRHVVCPLLNQMVSLVAGNFFLTLSRVSENLLKQSQITASLNCYITMTLHFIVKLYPIHGITNIDLITAILQERMDKLFVVHHPELFKFSIIYVST